MLILSTQPPYNTHIDRLSDPDNPLLTPLRIDIRVLVGAAKDARVLPARPRSRRALRHVLEVVAVAAGPGAGEELGQQARDGRLERGQRGADDADAGLDLRPEEGLLRGEGDVVGDSLGGDVEGDDADD